MDGNNTTPPTAFEMKGAAETLAAMVEQADKTGHALTFRVLRGFADQLMAWSKAMEKREEGASPVADLVFRPYHRAVKLENWSSTVTANVADLASNPKPEDFVTYRPLRPHEMPNDEDAIVIAGGISTYMRKVG